MLSIFEQAGIEVTTQGSIRQIFKDTGLDWLVEQREVYANFDHNTPCATQYQSLRKIPKLVANYRSDNREFLGMVHPRTYKVVQNVNAFDFIDELPGFTFEKVGMFENGKKVFVVGKSDEQIEIDNGDMIDFYLTFLHGHDGKSGIQFILCPIRMFCMNQMNLMLESATYKHTIKHTGDIPSKLNEIQKAIQKSRGYVSSLADTIEDLMNHKPDFDITEFTVKIIEDNDKDTKLIATRKQIARDEIISLYNNKSDIQNYKNTAFGMISAVSDFISHSEPKRKNVCINNMFIKNMEGHELLNKARKILQ